MPLPTISNTPLHGSLFLCRGPAPEPAFARDPRPAGPGGRPLPLATPGRGDCIEMDVQGESVAARGCRSTGVCGAVRFPVGGREPAVAQER